MDARTKARINIVLVIAAFIGPILILWLVLKAKPEIFDGLKKGSYGEKIEPAIPVDIGKLTVLDNKNFDVRLLSGFWTYIYLDSSHCDQLCKRNIFYLRQTRITQGKHADSVKVLWILTDTDKLEKLKPEIAKLTDVFIVIFPEKEKSAFLSLFKKIEKNASPQGSRSIFLMNPNQKLVRYYNTGNKAELDPKLAKGLRKDLRYILKFKIIKAGKREK